MKWKVFKFSFSRPLVQWQEDMFIGEMKGMAEYTKEELARLILKFDKPEIRLAIEKLPGAAAGFGQIMGKLMDMRLNIYQYVKMGKVDKQTYVYCIATEDFSLVNQKVSLLNRTISLVNPIDFGDRKLMDKCRTIVFPQIGFRSRSDYAIIVKEMEFTPEQFEKDQVIWN